MTAAIITITILLVIGLVVAREYAKFKQDQIEQEQIKPQIAEVFKEEERLVETQPVHVVVENPIDYKTNDPNPAIEAPKQEKPKRKYSAKKKSAKTKKTTK
jgi:hypothetical protein